MYHSSKYHAHKVVIDGMRFDSKTEGKRYEYLKELEEMGVIENLRMQVKYTLIPSQYSLATFDAQGKLKKGHLLERECAYKSDFEYDFKGHTVVEDVKGMRTKEYIIKRKLMLYRHNVRIREVKRWNEPVGGADDS